MTTPQRPKRNAAFKGDYNENSSRTRASRVNTILDSDQSLKEYKTTSVEEEQYSDNDTFNQVHKKTTKKPKTKILEDPGQDSAFSESRVNDLDNGPNENLSENDNNILNSQIHVPSEITPNLNKQTLDDSIHKTPSTPTNYTSVHNVAGPSL